MDTLAPAGDDLPSVAPLVAKGKKTRKARRNSDSAGPDADNESPFPTSVVCTASASSRSNSVELGLLLSLGVIFLYLFGCLESFLALPDDTVGALQSWHPGSNLNLARVEMMDGKNVQRDTTQEAKAQTTTHKKASANTAAVKDSSVKRTATSADIPAAKWPVSLRDEPNNYETILHPGDPSRTLSVPKFWAKPVHNNGLMSRETAMKIGSCIEPDSSGNYARGDTCPLHQRTIHLGIASYRDFQCRYTLESAFLRAKHPERLRVAVVDQIVDGEDPKCDEPIEPCDKNPEQALCKYKDQIDVFQTEAELSVGPVFARHIGYRMYRGEYYATQNDAHITYVKEWDIDIVNQMESLHNEMAVLTSYLTDVQGSITDDGISLRKTRPIMCNTHYEGGTQGMHLRHGSQPEGLPKITGTPQMQPYWAAGYSFARGHFVVNVPYDLYQPMIFQGEEMSIGIRAFTIGYDMYAFERSVCFHHYAVGENAKKRNKVKHFWENGAKFAGVGKRAMARLLGIVHMNPETNPSTWDHTDEDLYGIGGVRTPEKFYEVFGIDVEKKTTEDHLCRFVDWGGNMHKTFTPYLRKDGMGIDYGKIHYRFKDPAPGEK